MDCVIINAYVMLVKEKKYISDKEFALVGIMLMLLLEEIVWPN